MSGNQPDRERIAHELNENELAIVAFCRAQGLSKDEALKRLSRPSSSPILVQGQELAANLQVVAAELSKSQADPVSLSGHDDPT
jgi:hypothetical protein